jgi:hypothetical protein
MRRIFWLFPISVFLAGAALSAHAQLQQVPLLADPLAGLKYDNRYDLYVGLGYARLVPGETLLVGASLGGFDMQGTRWLTPRLGAMANLRGYYGDSANTALGVFSGRQNVGKGVPVFEHLFTAGPEYMLLRNKHAVFTVHGTAGIANGIFDSGIPSGTTAGDIGLFQNGTVFAATAGGAIDLNRSPRWAFRISQDMLVTHYQQQGHAADFQKNYAISVGALYRFKKKR